MTITRKYYNELIHLFSLLCVTQNNEPTKHIEIRNNIGNLIGRIKKFNLFQLSFSEEFQTTLFESKIDDFTQEKLFLVSEIHHELLECLDTTRLHYGGELMYYLFEIKLGLLNLSLEEFNRLQIIIQKKNKYHYLAGLTFKTEKDKTAEIKKTKSDQKKSIIKKEKISIKVAEYKKTELQLQKNYEIYSTYIQKHYNIIQDNFPFYKKLIRAYVTQAISKDIFELRVYGYEKGQDVSISVIDLYYDFCPSYFYNLEEITQPLNGSIITSLDRKTFTFPNFLTIESVHQELLQIFLRNANENQILNFISFLLKCEGFRINGEFHTQEYFDITAFKENRIYFYEVFHHKARSMKDIVKRIINLKGKTSDKNISYIFTTYPGDPIVNVLKKNNINALFLSDFTGKYFDLHNSNILHWYIQSIQSDLKVKKVTNQISFEGEALIKRLESCPPGDKYWSEFEEIGIDIFKFLFEDNFKKYLAEEQFETDLKNQRRDLIVSNYFNDSSSFWAEAKNEYKCKAIIVDFKNYSSKLNSTTLFSVTKYMNNKVGHFAIVFSRKGIDKTAVIEQKSWISQQKLIIEFNDMELKEMIREKIYGKDPSDRLKTKEFNLIAS